MLAEIFHQQRGKLLQVHDIVLDCACEGQMETHGGIVKLRPQDTGGIQKFQCAVNGHPLLCTGDAGTILGLSGLAVGNLIDKGGLAHVGDTQHHDTDGAANLPLFGIGGQLILQQFTHNSGKLVGACAALGVGFENSVTFSPEIGAPALCLLGIGLIHAVENDQAGFPCRHLVHIGVAAGDGDAGIQNLTYRVHILDFRHDHTLGLCHMTGEPA